MPGDTEGDDFHTAGRLSESVLAALELPSSAEAYLCGPPAFMQEVSAGLAALGLDAHHIHTELFGAAPSLTPASPPRRRGRPTRRRVSPAPARSSPSRAATSR